MTTTTLLFACIALGLIAAIGTASLLGRSGFPLTPMDERRIGCVDGLRGILALSVMAHHFTIWSLIARTGAGWKAPSTFFFDSLGVGGVALFFMITGLLFYGGVIKKGLSGPDARDRWIKVYVSRVFRIQPLLLASVSLVVVIAFFRSAAPAFPTTRDLISVLAWGTSWDTPDLFGVPDSKFINAGVLWSLKYEWIFYIFLLPICAGIRDLVPKAARSVTPVLLFLIALVVRKIFHSAGITTYLPLFAFGMVAYELQGAKIVTQLCLHWVASIVALAALGVAMVHWDTPYELRPLTLYALFFVIVAAGNSFWGFLKLRSVRILGECAFGIYLLHGSILSLMFREAGGLSLAREPALLALLPVAAIAAVLAAAAGYVFVEQPGIEAGRRLTRLLTQRGTRRGEATVEVAP